MPAESQPESSSEDKGQSIDIEEFNPFWSVWTQPSIQCQQILAGPLL